MSSEFPGIRSERLEQLIDIQHELTASVTKEQVLQHIVAAAARLAVCASAALLLYDEALKQLRIAAATRRMDKLATLSVPLEGSIAGAAFTRGEAVQVKAAGEDQRYFGDLETATGEKVSSLLALPLTDKERCLGVLVAEGKQGGQEFDTEDLLILTRLAAYAALVIDNANRYHALREELEKLHLGPKAVRKQQAQVKSLSQERLPEPDTSQAEIKRLNQLLQEAVLARQQLEVELQERSSCDQLTGVFNRRQFFVMAEQVFQQAIRYGTGLSIVVTDVDRFKRINEDYGHEVGDQALKRLAGFLSANLRASDILGRLEGQAFAILMPETGQEMACQASIRLIEGIRLLSIATTPSHAIHITISIGVAELNHLKDETIDDLIDRAEQALAEAKQGGRDRVMIHVAK